MYNGFYSDPYSREDIDGDEIYVKNDQIYDNETRSTVPTKKDSAPYDDLPVTLQNPINAKCRCNIIQSGGQIIKDTHPGILSKMLKFGNSSTNPTSSESSSESSSELSTETSKFSLNISLTITEIIQILVLIMIVVLIAITIRTRSRILVFTHDKPPNTTPTV